MRGAMVAGAALAGLWCGCAAAAADEPGDVEWLEPTEEPIGEAGPESTSGDICRTGCAGAALSGCYWVSRICAATSVITIGRATIPCSMAQLAACIALPAGVHLCQSRCEP